jgi:hypothetical protein
MKKSEISIVSALADAPSGLTYSDLKSKSNLSDPVLTENLKQLKKIGIVIQTNSEYVLAKAYWKMGNLKSTFEKRLKWVIEEIPFYAVSISALNDEALKKQIYEDFLAFHLDTLTRLILNFTRDAVISSLTKPENVRRDKDYNQVFQRLTKKRTQNFVKKVVYDWEGRTIEFHTAIQEEMQNWVIPYIQELSLAYYSNCQYMPKVILKDELNKIFEKETIEKTFWLKKLNEIDDEIAKNDPKFAKLLKKCRKSGKELYKETSKK